MTGAGDPLGCCRAWQMARAAGAASALWLAGCSTVPPNAGSNPRDPWERFNRQTFEFNSRLDKYLLKPLAKGYQAAVPHGIRLCISNGFDNLREIRNAVNDILQAKPEGVATDTGRLVINSTLGMAGCFDVAIRFGLERRYEDFGLTLARYGANTGPYLVLPVLGPSDVRDGVGLAADAYTLPTNYTQVAPVVARNALLGAQVIDARAAALQATDLIDRTALDRYQFTRDAYLQRRFSLQYEGNPPPPREDEDSDETGSEPSGTKAKPAQPAPPDRR